MQEVVKEGSQSSDKLTSESIPKDLPNPPWEDPAVGNPMVTRKMERHSVTGAPKSLIPQLRAFVRR